MENNSDVHFSQLEQNVHERTDSFLCEKCGMILYSEISFHFHLQYYHHKPLFNKWSSLIDECLQTEVSPNATNLDVLPTETFGNIVEMPKDFNKKNFDDNCSMKGNNGIFVYPSDDMNLLPDSYTGLAYKYNVTNEVKWIDNTKNPTQVLPTIQNIHSLSSNDQLISIKENVMCDLVCVICNKIFSKAMYLTQHNKSIHSGEKPFKCKRCGKRYQDNDAYEIHIAKHGDDKPHKCSNCEKSFNYKADLKRHKYLHAAIKPFSCEVCNKAFIRNDHMLKHVKSHIRRAHNKTSGVGGGSKRR